MDEAGISNLLFTIFDRWPSSASYRYCMQDLPGNGFPIAALLAPQAVRLRALGPAGETIQRFQWSGMANANSRALVAISVPAALNPALPAVDTICVAMDSGPVVPGLLAQIVSAGFASGLITRVFLERLSGVRLKDLGQVDQIEARKAQLVDYAQYGATDGSFQTRMSVLAENIPLEAHGMFLGWEAAGKLPVGAIGDPAYDAVWSAICTRVSWKELGQICSHTLLYLLTFVRGQYIANEFGLRQGGNAQQLSDALGKLDSSPQAQKLAELENAMSELFSSVVDFLKGPDTPVTVPIVQFLSGYHRGLLVSSKETFQTALKLGYGIGTRHGYRLGYERGLNDGFHRGFTAGLGDFLDDVVTVTNNIKSIVGTVGKIVSIFG